MPSVPCENRDLESAEALLAVQPGAAHRYQLVGSATGTDQSGAAHRYRPVGSEPADPPGSASQKNKCATALLADRSMAHRNASTMVTPETENWRIAIPGFDPGSFRSWFSLRRATAQIGSFSLCGGWAS